MLEISDLRERKEEMAAGLELKLFKDARQAIDRVLELDDLRKNTQNQLDNKLAASKSLAKEIGGLMKQGKKAEAEEIKQQTAALKSESKALSDQLAQIEEDLRNQLYKMPNYPHPSVKPGNSDEDNEIIEEKGSKPELPEGAKPHWELIKEYGIVDFELGNKITGAGFPVFRGAGARLQRGLVNFFIDQAIEAGYMEIQPPVVVNEASGVATGQLPDKEGQMYKVENEDLYLIPTAEVPVTNLYRDEIIKEQDLPIKNVAFTPCFRREAGSWGAHVRGLNRLHQFDKVEIVQVTQPEDSAKAHEEMCKHVTGLLEKLELPYRVLRLCGGDLTFTSHLTFDMEVYSAAQDKWLECSSISNFLTYQANRLKVRCKGKDKKSRLLHTLNGSALALPRIMAALLENNQTPEGIRIPKTLVPYVGFDIIKK
ncbi:MAG: serine--tRNA ligase [Cytophagales bacterium]|nr:serine--tRNA ligase [Cytophagales bacterium]